MKRIDITLSDNAIAYLDLLVKKYDSNRSAVIRMLLADAASKEMHEFFKEVSQ